MLFFICNSSNQQLLGRPPRASSPFLSRTSSTFLLSPQKRKHWCLLRRLWLAMIRDLLWNVYARAKARKEPGGDGPEAGEIKVRSCYTGSSIMSSKMRKSRHLRKFQTMSNQRAPRQLQLDDGTHPSPWGSMYSSLSRQIPVRWHAAELTVKWRSTKSVALFYIYMRTYCARLFITWNALITFPPTYPHTHRSIFAPAGNDACLFSSLE